MKITEENRPLLTNSSTMPSGTSRKVDVLVYCLVVLFAISSWIDVNGLWVELPLLVNALPEGWSLPSMLVFTIQAANVGPLLYAIAQRLAPNRVKEWPVIYVIIIVGGAACLLLVFLWRHTAVIAGHPRSVSMLSLGALLALVDCTSSVVYLPYMSSFPPKYMTALYVGEGLSGLLPGLVGLAQGIGAEPDCTPYNNSDGNVSFQPVYPAPNFSVSVFFLFLFFMLCLSLFSFTLLHFLPHCKRQRVTSLQTECTARYLAADENHLDKEEDETQAVIVQSVNNQAGSLPMPNVIFVGVCFLITWVNCLMNGMMPSIQSYAALPYGQSAYNLVVRLSSIANPVSCFISLFVPASSFWVLSLLSLIGSSLAAYIFALAVMSPSPPLLGIFGGQFLVVSVYVLMTGCFSYIKVNLASLMHKQGHRALLWCGVLTQAGSFIGALTAFILVNIFVIFKSAPAC